MSIHHDSIDNVYYNVSLHHVSINHDSIDNVYHNVSLHHDSIDNVYHNVSLHHDSVDNVYHNVSLHPVSINHDSIDNAYHNVSLHPVSRPADSRVPVLVLPGVVHLPDRLPGLGQPLGVQLGTGAGARGDVWGPERPWSGVLSRALLGSGGGG